MSTSTLGNDLFKFMPLLLIKAFCCTFLYYRVGKEKLSITEKEKLANYDIIRGCKLLFVDWYLLLMPQQGIRLISNRR